jgi:hypothetical protein
MLQDQWCEGGVNGRATGGRGQVEHDLRGPGFVNVKMSIGLIDLVLTKNYGKGSSLAI